MVDCAGCAAKLGQRALNDAVQGLFEGVEYDPRVLVGFGTLDDAGVFLLNESTALVQTLDFFPPVVDDPYMFGQIAAANALSDVYAMGGTPLTALNITCFPSSLHPSVLNAILRGGLDQCAAAGVSVLGGHTVDDPVIKFGLSVTGIVDPNHVWTNSGARVGDALLLSKALGVGIVTTGIKRGLAKDDVQGIAIDSMRTLNRGARDILATKCIHACTDVTGFSFLGHLYQMMRASNTVARVSSANVPLLAGALELSKHGCVPGGTQRNKDYTGPHVHVAADLDEALINLMYDPQSSGGLLAALDHNEAKAALAQMKAIGLDASIVGTVVEVGQGSIIVE